MTGAPMSPDSPSNPFWPIMESSSPLDTDGEPSSARGTTTVVLLPLLPNGISCSFAMGVESRGELNTCSCKSKD